MVETNIDTILAGWRIAQRRRLSPASTTLVPFLKWAGGKRWLMSISESLRGAFTGRYIEPFVGSGAMFFGVNPEAAILSDANKELIRTYQAIKNDWAAVYARLKEHDRHHSSDYYYRVRDMRTRSEHGHAARFIYLNRTCWNGLYRVNKRGVFNTPIGTKSSALLSTDDFEAAANRLAVAELLHADFESTLSLAKLGDLIFADPPYTVRHQHNGFVKYNQRLFSWEDQERLHEALVAAKKRGAKILCTNADHASIRKLYGDEFKIASLTRFSPIAGKGGTRGSYAEVLIYT